jgi:DNA-binding IscR family transcriptional regulator
LHKIPRNPHTTAEIASLTKKPEYYLSKVLLMLAKHEMVYSKKGLHGGYILAQLPENLPLLNMINAVASYKAY